MKFNAIVKTCGFSAKWQLQRQMRRTKTYNILHGNEIDSNRDSQGHEMDRITQKYISLIIIQLSNFLPKDPGKFVMKRRPTEENP